MILCECRRCQRRSQCQFRPNDPPDCQCQRSLFHFPLTLVSKAPYTRQSAGFPHPQTRWRPRTPFLLRGLSSPASVRFIGSAPSDDPACFQMPCKTPACNAFIRNP
ncbi:hypothetical protein BSIN_2269 [Burkholderia singularis]|uniref:Uncharacterized protein n=1 Tax=Burkholderia singularis TaxID=1503053 RepID=A0A238H1H0_9BURK|nr:hypothetical protein BSIN_2269 [Burkholderia singularis]